ncbi:MAG: hypothetical protein ONB49_16630, partial [candidate division KSB1 bacterium]|nr:hypothetical protein [candidate division KSB1 bacterium]
MDLRGKLEAWTGIQIQANLSGFAFARWGANDAIDPGEIETILSETFQGLPGCGFQFGAVFC